LHFLFSRFYVEYIYLEYADPKNLEELRSRRFKLHANGLTEQQKQEISKKSAVVWAYKSHTRCIFSCFFRFSGEKTLHNVFSFGFTGKTGKRW